MNMLSDHWLCITSVSNNDGAGHRHTTGEHRAHDNREQRKTGVNILYTGHGQ